MKTLSEIIRDCDYRDIVNYDFDYDGYDDYTSGWLTIKTNQHDEDYDLVIEKRKIYLSKGYVICQIIGDTAKKWLDIADELFENRFADEIEEAKKDLAYNNWLDYQDSLRYDI